MPGKGALVLWSVLAQRSKMLSRARTTGPGRSQDRTTQSASYSVILLLLAGRNFILYHQHLVHLNFCSLYKFTAKPFPSLPISLQSALVIDSSATAHTGTDGPFLAFIPTVYGTLIKPLTLTRLCSASTAPLPVLALQPLLL